MDPISLPTPSVALAAAPEPRPKDAADAARQFEALLLAQLLREAHQSSAGDDKDATQDTMWDVAAQHFAHVMAKNGGLGLAKLIASGLPKE
jgi:Rod binding domain-containing protein